MFHKMQSTNCNKHKIQQIFIIYVINIMLYEFIKNYFP